MKQKEIEVKCFYCKNEPEPGWLETDNNGPIVPCPICNPKGKYDGCIQSGDTSR